MRYTYIYTHVCTLSPCGLYLQQYSDTLTHSTVCQLMLCVHTSSATRRATGLQVYTCVCVYIYMYLGHLHSVHYIILYMYNYI